MSALRLERSQEEGWSVEPGFGPVADEFRSNFARGSELGASFSAVVEGRLVVDVWGGLAARTSSRPWQADTMQVIFSGTKGLVALCLLMLIDRGQLDIDLPVSAYWPEFGAEGKEGVTVRQVVTHSAGLPGFMERVDIVDLTDDRKMEALLAAEPQFADPRAHRTYHALTFGWLCGGLIRRIDGRSVGSFFCEEIAKPLGLDLFIGLPPRLESRVGQIELGRSFIELSRAAPSRGEEDVLLDAVWGNPAVFTAASFPWNRKSFHRAEIPGVNGIGTSRSIAQLYGSVDQLIGEETLRRGTVPLATRVDALFGDDEIWGSGFQLQSGLRLFGPPQDAFGHSGAGGSVHGRWPGHDTGFSYSMNLMQQHRQGDPRPASLLASLHRSIAS